MSYQAANGAKIRNLGAQFVKGKTEAGEEASMRFQVAEVTKALGAVGKICEAGNRVIFDEEGSFIEDKKTGRKTTIRKERGCYFLDLYVKEGKDGAMIANTAAEEVFSRLEQELP